MRRKTMGGRASWRFGGGIGAAVVVELRGDFGVELARAGVVEGVGGLTIVDEGLDDISNGGAHRSDHDFFAVG